MALFEIPGLSGVQPLRRFRVNQDHPLAQGLVLASTPAGIFLPKTGYWLPFGALVDTVVSGNLVYGRASMTLPESLTASTCSAVVRLRLESDPGTYPTVGLAQYASGSDNFGFGVSWDDTAGQIAPTARSNISGFGLSTYAVTPPYEEHVCVTVNGWGGSSGAFYRNAATSGTTATPAGTFADKVNSFILGSDTLRSAYFFLYHRVISRDEDLALYLDPFCFLEEEPIWVPVSAGGGSYSLTAEQGSYTITGQAAGLLAGRVLAAAQGSYTLSGQDVALLKGNTLTADQGSYALTGQDVGLLRGLLLSAAQGSYALSGQDATLTYTTLGAFSLTADQGSYTLTGQSVSLLWGHVLAAAQGSYTLNGQDATLTYTPVGAYILTAGQGSYALTGQDVLLQWGHVLAAAQGSYTLTGQAATLSRGLVLAAAQGSYALNGQAAAFRRTYVLSAGYGSYALTGQIVSLTYSGAALEALEYLLLISHITQSMSKTSKVTMEVDLISRIQQQLDGSSSI